MEDSAPAASHTKASAEAHRYRHSNRECVLAASFKRLTRRFVCARSNFPLCCEPRRSALL